MSPLMKIGRSVFPNSLLVCSSLPANGCLPRPMRKMSSRKRSFASGSVITTWTIVRLLYAAVRSIALDFLRRESRRARRESNAVAETESSVQPKFAIEDESQQALAAAVDGLPHEQREVLVMKIWNDLTFAEIGSALGISQNTAASRYRYALAALRRDPLHNERLF